VPAREPPIIRVTRFLELPLRGLEGDDISQVKITAHQWMEGKLLLDFQYTATFHSFNNKGAWNGTRQATLPAIALLDPVKGEWNVISCPEPALAAQNNLYYRSTLLRGALFTSDGQKIQQYDFQSRRWKVLGLSTEDNFQLFAIRGRLYAANGTTILEIVDGGKSSRVLASTRRNPPASTLDRLPELGIPILFEGADHSLLVWVQNKIYAWAQDDWQEKIEASSVVQPQLFDAGLLFRTGASSGQLPRIFRFLGGATSPTLCLIERVPPEHPEFRNLYRPTAGSLSPQKPLWRCPEKMALGNLPVALRREDLFLLADRSGVRQIVNDRHLIVKEEIVPHNGCNAELFCFSHELRTPQIVRLKFEAPNGCPPVPGVDLGARWVFGRSPPGWMVFAGDLVCFGLESSGIESSEWHRVGCPPGIWTMAASELEAVSAVERKIQLAEISRERLAIEHRQQAVIAKYDRNHNGRVDLEERSDALIDPAFLEMEVHKIDANGNGTLDLDELAWFDANSNRILDADEEKATDRAQDFLAQKTFAALDLDENGVLGASEWSNFQARRGAPVTTGNFPAQAFADRRPSMDLAAFATYCRQATRMQLTRGNRVSGPVDPWTQRRGPPPSIKETVENYWTRTNGNVAGPEMKSPR
jgi:hypothetical protein